MTNTFEYNFEYAVHRFAPLALSQLRNVYEGEQGDKKAIEALKDRNAGEEARCKVVKRWLQNYSVFQGISDADRMLFTAAIVKWADSRILQTDLNVEGIITAHKSLCSALQEIQNRKFTSMASKALWLCYPKSVPMYDSFVDHSLLVISKLENIYPIPDRKSEYHQFVHIWQVLYGRYSDALAIYESVYPYRVRIFDKILWLIGDRRYVQRVDPSQPDSD